MSFKSGPTIAQILQASGPAAIKSLLQGQRFITHRLRERQERNQIFIAPMLITSNVEALQIPMTWTKRDDERADYEKCSLVETLIQDAMHAIDLLIFFKTETGMAVISDEHHYLLYPAYISSTTMTSLMYMCSMGVFSSGGNKA